MWRSVLFFLILSGRRLNLGDSGDGGGDTDGGGESGGLVSESARLSRLRDLHLYLNSVTFLGLNTGLGSEGCFTSRRVSRDLQVIFVPLRCFWDGRVADVWRADVRLSFGAVTLDSETNCIPGSENPRKRLLLSPRPRMGTGNRSISEAMMLCFLLKDGTGRRWSSGTSSWEPLLDDPPLLLLLLEPRLWLQGEKGLLNFTYNLQPSS